MHRKNILLVLFSVIFVAVASGCGGVEAVPATETPALTDIPASTDTPEPSPTNTPDPCSEDILLEWLDKVIPIMDELDQHTSDFVFSGLSTVADNLEFYKESAQVRIDETKMIEAPECAEKATEHVLATNEAFLELLIHFYDNEDEEAAIEAMVERTNQVDLFIGELEKLGLLE